MWNKCREVADQLPWLLFPCGIDIHGESKFLDTHCKKEIKFSASLTFLSCLINLIVHEHSCKTREY